MNLHTLYGVSPAGFRAGASSDGSANPRGGLTSGPRRQTTPRANAPDGFQRAIAFVEGRGLFLVARDGIHPKLGSLTTGSGFAVGVGFRDRDLFRRRGMLEMWIAASAKKYWAAELRATFPDLAGGRMMADAVATIREYPREDFFGLGPQSQRANHSTFSLRSEEVAARLGLRIAPILTVGGGLGLLNPQTSGGKDASVPSLEQLFAPVATPGFRADTQFIRSSGFVDIDYREPRNARRGGWYRAELTRFADHNGEAWNFTRSDIDLRQYIGFFADRRVIALRANMASLYAPDDGSRVPFYLMPSLGGNDSLRGFRNYRFRGPHALLLQGEYRWELWSGLDAALFYDAGKVALRRRDLNLRDLETDYGFGFRFNTANGVIMRVDAAFGSQDGKHLHIVFGGVF
ncbi:MAG TPA: BamA/TamA family outer membrane protein [Vicinamibacterales bacterium]|nr:BamA/TamA family outer membrane protein [Vicinamibacterales bacterium]